MTAIKNEISITPLGTVSPYCKNNFNCPGFLINYKDKKILLDCGNGITRLMKFPDDLNNLNVIISHLHKDHYGDLGAIQYVSYVYHNLGQLENKVNVYLPPREGKEGDILSINNNDNITSVRESYTNYYTIDKPVIIDNLKLSFAYNPIHSVNAYFIKIECNGLKIVYATDTGKNGINYLMPFAKDADLLICESSLLTSYNKQSTYHLTAHEAASFAHLLNAKQLMLMHFWPETPKNEYLNEAKQVFENTIVAEEGKKLVLKG